MSEIIVLHTNSLFEILMYHKWYIGFIINYAADMSFYILKKLFYQAQKKVRIYKLSILHFMNTKLNTTSYYYDRNNV